MSDRRILVILVLLLLISVLFVSVMLLRARFNVDYANANAALEQWDLYVEATIRAATPKP